MPSQSDAIIPRNGRRVNYEVRHPVQAHPFVCCFSAESPKMRHAARNEPLDTALPARSAVLRKRAVVLILAGLLKRE